MKKFLLLFCTIFFSSIVMVSAQRSVEILPDVDTLYVCTDSTTQLSASEAFSYNWSPAAIFDDPSIQNPMATPTAPTLVTLEANVNGILQRDTILIIPTTPTLSLDQSTDDICRGEIVTIRANNNVLSQGLVWEQTEELIFIDSISDRIIFQPTFTREYKAEIDLNGCTIRDSLTVTVRPPNVEIQNEDTVLLCAGSDVTLAAVTSTGLLNGLSWSPSIGLSDTVSAEVIASPMGNTTYYATFVEDGCVIVDSVFVQVDSIPTDLSIEKDEDKEVYCNGDVVTLKSPIYDQLAYPNIEHIWSTIKIFPDPGENPVGNLGFETPDTLYNLVFTAQDSAVYKRVTRSGGCLDSAEVLIPVIPPKEIVITPNPAIICPGEVIDLTAEFEGAGEIEWMPEEAINGPNDQKTVRVGPLTEDTEVTIQVEEEGCPSSQSITVQTLPSLINFTAQTVICQGDNIRLNLATVPGATYSWSSPGNPDFSTDPQLSVSPDETTQYTVEATFGECPPANANIEIGVIPPADVFIDPSELTICPLQTFTLMAIGNAPPFASERFTWEFGGSTQNGDDLTLRTIDSDAVFNLTYVVGIPNGRQCFSDQASANITVLELPEITSFDVIPSTAVSPGILLGESVNITANIVGNIDGFDFQWMANDNNIDGNGASISDSPTEDTNYKLTLTSGDESACTVEGDINIKVLVPDYDIPNVFTPNGDGINDFFNVAFVNVADVNEFIKEFQIFNRWGQLVYDNDTPETGWDGKVNGNPAPSDVYVYKIVLNTTEGEVEETGEVTLIR